MNIIIGNILSFIGSSIDFTFNIKFNEKSKILKGNLISSTLSLISYVFFKAYDGCITAIITLFRLITIYLKDKYNKKFDFLFIFFIALYSLMFFKYSGIQTIILFLSLMCSFVPKWIFKDMQKIRVGELLANILAIIYNIVICNYAVILLQVINIIIILIAIKKWSKKYNHRYKN